jgi:hypothetical protein
MPNILTFTNTPEQERKNRIKLSLAAYAYEFDNNSIMTDSDFDELSKCIDVTMPTTETYHTKEQLLRYTALDAFFIKEFQADTGQWIHKHPELPVLAALYTKLYKTNTRKRRKKTK